MKKSKGQKSELLQLPNVGPKTIAQMNAIGITTIKQFLRVGPEKIYERCCKKQGVTIHRAFLYVLRAAMFWCYNKDKRDQALRWWMWKDLKPIRIIRSH
jgi:hypothetical protein